MFLVIFLIEHYGVLKLIYYPPVKTLAWLLPRLNCVSRYLGRNTTKPDTIMSSIQAPRHVTTYTGFLRSRHMDTGMSVDK